MPVIALRDYNYKTNNLFFFKIQVAFQNYLNMRRRKRNERFNRKINFLWEMTYEYYLKKFFDEKTNKVDFPKFVYEQKKARLQEAVQAADFAISIARMQGRKHIEKCFNREFNKKIKKLDHKRQVILKKLYA